MFLAVMALPFSLFGQPDPPTGASKRTLSGLPLIVLQNSQNAERPIFREKTKQAWDLLMPATSDM